MSRVINVHEAKTHLSRLLDKAHAGEEIVLGNAGKPDRNEIVVSAASAWEIATKQRLGKLGLPHLILRR